MYVYVVIGQFTESIIPSIHVSIHKYPNSAKNKAFRVGGIVVRRFLHEGEEVDEHPDFKLWADDTDSS